MTSGGGAASSGDGGRGRAAGLADWYEQEGRHSLAWRATTRRWPVLVSEVMLQQTQVLRVSQAWPAFIAAFPTPEAMAAAGPGAVIAAWGRLGYPRRARRLWEAARIIATSGWPEDLTELAGVGPYTAAAVAAQADGADVIAVDTNVRRVAQRFAGSILDDRRAASVAEAVARPLAARDALLALMDLGALVCRSREPECTACPVKTGCATRGELAGEGPRAQGRYRGSLRQRRGDVLSRLRAGPAPTSDLDAVALESLIEDQLAEVRADRALLARS